jgi:hypothetical protein
MLRIRQIVLAARDLEGSVSQLEHGLGVRVVYRDPLVAEFGLHNALLLAGDQFIEVVSPTRPDTAAGRHIERHGDSAYMLILQTDDLARDKARLAKLGVRTVWSADYPDIHAVHLHPKDIGGAIVSLDQPVPPESWRWAGPSWQSQVTPQAVRSIVECQMGARDPEALAARWSEVLGTPAPVDGRIALEGGSLRFEKAPADLMLGFGLQRASGPARELTICNTRFVLSQG